MRKTVIIVVVLAALAGLIYFSGLLETPTDELGPEETDQPSEPEVQEPGHEEPVEGTLKGVSLSPGASWRTTSSPSSPRPPRLVRS